MSCGSDKPDHKDTVDRFALINGKRYKVFTFGNNLNLTGQPALPMSGFIVDDIAVLDEVPVRSLKSKSAGFAPFSPDSEGPKTVLYIRADFPDAVGDPGDLNTVSNWMDVVSEYMAENSYGKMSMQTTFVPGLCRMPQNAAFYGVANFDQMLTDAKAEALTKGFDADPFDFFILLTPEGTGAADFPYSGRAKLGEPGVHVITPKYKLRTIAHELGHNIGLWHANYWLTDSETPIGRDSIGGGYAGDGSNAEWFEYGHRYSGMNAQNTPDMLDKSAHFSIREKWEVDWLTGSDLAVTTTSAVFRIFRHDHGDVTGTPRGVRIDLDATDYTSSGRQYYLSYRRNYATNAWLNNGLQIDWARTSYGPDGTIMLDMTPYSDDNPNSSSNSWEKDNPDKSDGALVIGRTFSDSEAGIHITPIAKGGVLTNAYIDAIIKVGMFPSNLPPSLTLTASTNQAPVGSNIQFTVHAADPDGDTLAYYWDFGDRMITESALNASNATRSWTSPGQYVLRCVVSDMCGGTVSTTLLLTIGSPGTVFSIQGRVTSAASGIENVRVYSDAGHSAFTDSFGQYIFANLPAATYTVGVQKTGTDLSLLFTNPVVVGPSATGIDFKEPGIDGVEIHESGDSTDVSEDGGNDSYDLVLDKPPLADVTIVLSFDTNQISANPTNLTFTPMNYGNAQTIMISAVDDGILESDPHVSIITHSISSADRVFGGFALSNVHVSIDDNETNAPPVVTITCPTSDVVWLPSNTRIELESIASDDGIPGGSPSTLWSLNSGPTSVVFGTANSSNTAVTFLQDGTYQILITADDGLQQATDMIVVNVGGTPTPQVSQSNLIVHLKLDETNGVIAIDSAGSNHSGTVTDAAWKPTGGRVDGAIEFDGASHVIQIATSTDINNTAVPARTIALWFKATNVNTATEQTLYKEGDKSKGLTMYIVNGVVRVRGKRTGGGGWTADVGTNVTSSTWHHLALTLEAGSVNELKGYLNGELFGTAATGELSVHDKAISMGNLIDTTSFLSGNSSGNERYTGLIDNFLLYNRVLSQAEIQSMIVSTANVGPTVTAGTNTSGQIILSQSLEGYARDDGLPTPPGTLTALWTTVSGPGTPTFGDSGQTNTSVTFDVPGTYTLRLTVFDGAIKTSDDVELSIAPDNDGDGLADAIDPDDDNDGMPDVWEVENGLNKFVNDAATDSDGDGSNNLEEYLADTDPKNPNIFLRIAGVTIPYPQTITFSSSVNRVYSLDYSDSLRPAAWTGLASNVPGSNAVIGISNTNVPVESIRYYRLKAAIP